MVNLLEVHPNPQKLAAAYPTEVAAIDFETATEQRSSACAVGVAIPRTDGSIEARSWFVRPPRNEYAGFNMMIHGITPEDTAGAPSLPDVWPEIDAFIGNRSLVAHNAAFDLSVLRRSFAVHGAVAPGTTATCAPTGSLRRYGRTVGATDSTTLPETLDSKPTNTTIHDGMLGQRHRSPMR